MKKVWRFIKNWNIGWISVMKYTGSIKRKYYLIIIFSIILSTYATYSILNAFYLNSHSQYMKTYITSLLTYIQNDPNHLQEMLDWTEENLNLQIYILENVEELLSEIPPHLDKDKVLSMNDIQQLEIGNMVINEMKASDIEVNLLIFIMPIIENGVDEKLLFLHVPINNLKGEEAVFSKLTILFAFFSIGITIIITKKIFGKSYNQLQDIKAAAVEVSKGNFDVKIWEKSSDEIGEITTVFNTMSAALKNEQTLIKEFMEDFSHEIKTPLAHVKSYNEALMNRVIQGEEEQQKCYQVIDRETNRLQRLIQNFSDYSKLDAQAVELVRCPIVFAQSVEDIILKYELIFKEKNIKLDMKLDYDIIIFADEERLEQIIQNIIQNAIRYSKNDACIDIILEKKATTCVLAIADNGIGISEEHLSVITKRFMRVNKVRSRKEAGTGLGLSIVEKLMELHEGKMVIDSQLGVGTTVKLEFPLLTLGE